MGLAELAVLLLKNWKLVVGIILVLTISAYAGTQKVRADHYHDAIYNPRTGWAVQLTSCKAAVAAQNDAVAALGRERDQLQADLARNGQEAAALLKEREKRIQALLDMPKGGDCTANLERFARQLRGTTWSE